MFHLSTEIARTPHDVFAYLTRITDAPLWYSAVEAVEPLDAGPVHLGTRALFRRHIGGAAVENEVEVSAFEADRQFALSSVSGPTPFVYRYRLERAPNGTRLLLVGEISGEGLPRPLSLLKPFAETLFKRGMARNLRTLKRLLEKA
jgi:polyketide cyclase/dehydrase/lipid transport protein